MSVKEDYLELKSKWIHSHGIEREEVQQQLDAFFTALDENPAVLSIVCYHSRIPLLFVV